MPERNDYKTGRSGGGYNGGNGNGGFGGNAFAGAGGGPLGAYVPPHSIEAEQSTLGAMLIERSAVEKVFDILDKEDFYRENHQTLFDVITFLAERDEPIDLVTVPNELKNRDQLDAIGGMAYLAALFDTVPTAANVEYYAKIVEEKATLRRLISASLEIIGSARGEVEDVGEVLDEAERSIFGVSQQRAVAYFSPLRTLLLSVYDKAEELSEMKSRISGLSTGIHDFDMITSGLQNTDLIIVAARPSMGKTSLCLSIAEHVAIKEHKPVAIFSLEMSKEQLALRMLCSQAQVNSHKLRTGHLTEDEWGKLAQVVQGMYEAPIFIDDATETSALTMRAKCRRLMAEHNGLGLIIVDYLQLMRSHRRTENRVQEIGEIARGLKSLGRELKVPVVALSQLSRAVESRENKRPMLSDLRECVIGDTRLMDAAIGKLVLIRDIQAGDRILAMDSRQKIRPFDVERVWSTGIKPVFTLKTRTGRGLTATANHPLLTAQGWKRLGELQVGDIIATALPEYDFGDGVYPSDEELLSLPPEVWRLLPEETERRIRPRRDICAKFAESLKDELLGVWANSDLLWEEIKSITPAGEEEVFDITVPGCANFLANGIVAHNSGSIEAEADMVCFLYREAYYKMKEAFNVEGGERPERSEMEETEIIVGKHRNGPTGMVKVGFLPEFAKFVDLDLTRTDEPTGF
jgi:replicative DNA helicase